MTSAILVLLELCYWVTEGYRFSHTFQSFLFTRESYGKISNHQ